MKSLLYPALALNILLLVRYHADLVLRGRFRGWPVTEGVTLFTLSLVAYP